MKPSLQIDIKTTSGKGEGEKGVEEIR